MLSFKERANWTPAVARNQFRQNFFPFVQSGGIAAPYTQVSVHFVPSAEAKLFAEFCRLNHTPCPVVYQSEPGQVTAPPLAADLDIRQVASAYRTKLCLVCTKQASWRKFGLKDHFAKAIGHLHDDVILLL